jgi:hypothetical protein
LIVNRHAGESELSSLIGPMSPEDVYGNLEKGSETHCRVDFTHNSSRDWRNIS